MKFKYGGSTFDKYINPLFILQKKVVRLVSHVKIKDDNGNYNHSSLLFKDLRVLKIKDIFRNQIALLVFDCLQGTSYQEYKQVLILNSNVHHYATRNNSFGIGKCKILEKKNVFVPYSRTFNYGQKSIRVVGPKIWNDIPLVIRNNTS